jgi:hypothetical protein
MALLEPQPGPVSSAPVPVIDAGGKTASLFLGVMGTPYQSELATSLFRMVHESLDQGMKVVVWTCGYATMLTQNTLVRPKDLFEPSARGPNPSTSEMARALLEYSQGRLQWYVCRYCMEERGASQQIEEVQIKIPFSFYHYLNEAETSLVMGVKS